MDTPITNDINIISCCSPNFFYINMLLPRLFPFYIKVRINNATGGIIKH